MRGQTHFLTWHLDTNLDTGTQLGARYQLPFNARPVNVVLLIQTPPTGTAGLTVDILADRVSIFGTKPTLDAGQAATKRNNLFAAAYYEIPAGATYTLDITRIGRGGLTGNNLTVMLQLEERTTPGVN